jgi:beta-galactosidase
LRAVSRKNGNSVLTAEVRTAEAPAKLELVADRKVIKSDGTDLSFITVRVLDKNGTLVPRADNLVHFDISGPAFIAGVDNGSEISHESYKGNQRKAFHGMALAIVQSKGKPGTVRLKATADGLTAASVAITAR